jgi:hypothetical protein
VLTFSSLLELCVGRLHCDKYSFEQLFIVAANRSICSGCLYRMQHIVIIYSNFVSQRFERTCIAQIQNKIDSEIFLCSGFIVSFLCLQVLN